MSEIKERFKTAAKDNKFSNWFTVNKVVPANMRFPRGIFLINGCEYHVEAQLFKQLYRTPINEPQYICARTQLANRKSDKI